MKRAFFILLSSFGLCRSTFSQLTRRVAMTAQQLAETGTLEPKAIRLTPKSLPGETV